jgi:hypothetical protein
MFSAACGRAAWKEGWNDIGCQLVLIGLATVAFRYSVSFYSTTPRVRFLSL